MEIRIYTDAQGYAPFEQWLNQLPDRIARANIRAIEYLKDWKERGKP